MGSLASRRTLRAGVVVHQVGRENPDEAKVAALVGIAARGPTRWTPASARTAVPPGRLRQATRRAPVPDIDSEVFATHTPLLGPRCGRRQSRGRSMMKRLGS